MPEPEPKPDDPKADLIGRLTSRAFAIPIMATWMLWEGRITEDNWLIACGIFGGVNAIEKFKKGTK